MSWLRRLRYVALGLSLAYAFPAACGSGGIVGGECKNADCTASAASANGGDSSKPTGGASNIGNATGEAGNGATAAVSQGGDGQLPDGGFFDSPVDGETDAGPPVDCLPPHDSPSHCGDCDTRCTEPAPLCAPSSDGGFVCVPKCVPPLVECQGQCVDPDSFNSDPDNCGRCGNECPSDICQAGKCVGARFGHIALMCMDLGSAMTDSAAAALLGNAISIPSTTPVKVLAFTLGASKVAVSRTNNIIAARVADVEIDEVKSVDAVTEQLNINDYQVFLIHDLDGAQAGAPEDAASKWESASVLSSFARAGGVIIVLDGGDGTGEMGQLINAGNLLGSSGTISGHQDITDQDVINAAPFDVLGAKGVLSPSRGTSHTCTFQTDAVDADDVVFVLTDVDGEPVVIHRVVAP